MRRPSVRTARNVWIAGFSLAAVLQGVFGRRFARGAAWGRNAGWQREIAVWNVGTLVTAAGLAGLGPEADRAQVRGFAVLSTLFGLNHLAAALRSPRSGSNWFGAGLNAVGITAGVAALVAPRPAPRGPDER